MVNKVILVGNLGQDPELRYTPNGDAVCNFSVATSESYKDKNGEWQSKTEWHNIVVWRKLGEICGNILKKGSTVYLEGKIQTRKWEDREGSTRYTTEIVCYEMKKLDKEQKERSHEETIKSAQKTFEEPAFNPDDEIPF